MLQTAYRRCTANINKTLLPTSPALVRNNPIAVVSGKTDYTLSLDIVRTGTDSNSPSSILHFTTGTDCCGFGSRSPAIWFLSGSTGLLVIIGYHKIVQHSVSFNNMTTLVQNSLHTLHYLFIYFMHIR